jgi:PIN domain nuclease of toxin-antitoxin system
VNDLVLDASALIALLRREPGAERVADRLALAVIGTVNLAEVVSKFVRDGLPIDGLRDTIDELDLEILPFDEWLAYRAGELRIATRHHGLSLGDRACLALAERLGATAVTADRAWAALDVGIEVELIR